LRSMSLTKDDLRPLLHFIQLEVTRRERGYVVQLPLVTVSLEGNPLEPEYPAGIANALRILSQPIPERGSEKRRCFTCARSLSLPPQSREPVLPERGALSEGDADGEEYTHIFPKTDRRSRLSIRRTFEEECATLSRLLDSRIAERAGWTKRRARPQTLRNEWGGAHEQISNHHVYPSFNHPWPNSPSTHGSSVGSGNAASIALAAIPDMGLECGFGPPHHCAVFDTGTSPALMQESPTIGGSRLPENAQSRRVSAIPDRSAELGFGPPPRDTTPYFSGPGPASDSDQDANSNRGGSSDATPERNQVAIEMRELEPFQSSQELGDFDEMLWADRTKERLCLWELRESQGYEDAVANGAWPHQAFAELEHGHSPDFGPRAHSF